MHGRADPCSYDLPQYLLALCEVYVLLSPLWKMLPAKPFHLPFPTKTRILIQYTAIHALLAFIILAVAVSMYGFMTYVKCPVLYTPKTKYQGTSVHERVTSVVSQ